jgi:hypothetical protein
MSSRVSTPTARRICSPFTNKLLPSFPYQQRLILMSTDYRLPPVALELRFDSLLVFSCPPRPAFMRIFLPRPINLVQELKPLVRVELADTSGGDQTLLLTVSANRVCQSSCSLLVTFLSSPGLWPVRLAHSAIHENRSPSSILQFVSKMWKMAMKKRFFSTLMI